MHHSKLHAPTHARTRIHIREGVHTRMRAYAHVCMYRRHTLAHQHACMHACIPPAPTCARARACALAPIRRHTTRLFKHTCARTHVGAYSCVTITHSSLHATMSDEHTCVAPRKQTRSHTRHTPMRQLVLMLMLTPHGNAAAKA